MVLIGVSLVENFLTIKAVLKSFELDSSLKINFDNRCLFGVNVGRSFLDRGEKYLRCKMVILPFKYLGLLVSENSKKE